MMKFDVDDDDVIAGRLNVEGLPSILFFKVRMESVESFIALRVFLTALYVIATLVTLRRMVNY